MSTEVLDERGGPSLDEGNILQAFRLIDSRLAAATERDPLVAFRSRLVGELLGDADRVDATLSPDFQLVTHAGGQTTVSERASIVAAIRRGDALIWVELETLAVDGPVIAGSGVLRTVRPEVDASSDGEVGYVTLSTVPLAIFLHFNGALMDTETIYLDVAASRSERLARSLVPSTARLGALLDPDAA